MNFCGPAKVDQDMGVISPREEKKVDVQPSSSSFVGAHEPPKTPSSASSVRPYHGASPSPSLLNPISDDDWRESTSRLSIFCPKLPSPKTSEILLRRLKAGYRLMLYTEKSYHSSVLSLSEDFQFLRVTGESIGIAESNGAEEEKRGDSIFIRISNILRLDIGIIPDDATKCLTLERVNPMTCFCVVTKVAIGRFQKLDFTTATTADRESILSALAIVLKPEEEERPTLILHPRLPRSDQYLASQKSPCYNHFLSESGIQTQIPSHDTSSVNSNVISRDVDLSKRTRIYASTPPRPEKSGTTVRTPRTPRDQGTELALIDSPDSDDQMLGPEERPIEDEIVVPVLHKKEGESPLIQESGWFGLPEGTIISGGSSTTLWCTDDICSGALKDFSQTFQCIFVPNPSPENSLESADNRQEVANYIAYVLGAPSTVQPSPNEERSKSIHKSDSRTDGTAPNPNFHNRASLLNAPAKRWQQLQSEMTFSSALERSKQHMHVIQTTKSMDDIEGLSYMQSEQPMEISFFDATGYLSSLVDQLLPEAEHCDENSIKYYDSDQEDVRPRNFNGQSSRAIAVTMIQPGGKSSTVKRNRITFKPRNVGLKIAEEEVLKVVDVMKAATLTLLWHPNPGSPDGGKPVCIEAWIERGTYLSSMTYIQPKFMWKTAFESRLERERKVNVALTRPEFIDLLEIARVQEDVTIDRSTHPLAQSKSCFAVVTRNCTYIFQSRTVKEKKQIVYGLKLTVARLASLLMVRDMRAVQEFFEPVSAQVPGQAPEWTK